MAEHGESGISRGRDIIFVIARMWRDQQLEMVLLRFISLWLLIFALEYWGRLIGVFGGADYRFDTMAQHWRVVTPTLAIAMPIAALGLWVIATWGIVLWLPIAVLEIAMYGWFSNDFGWSPFRVGFHTVTLSLYGMLGASEYFWLTNRKN